MRDGISDLEEIELRDIESKVKNVNSSYSEGPLSPFNIRSLTKIDKLQFIDERDNKISDIIKKSSCGVLYRLLNLSSEYISPVKKKKIASWVRFEVDSEIEISENKVSLISERSASILRLQSRALKMEKFSVRRLHIETFLKDRSSFKFPVKL